MRRGAVVLIPFAAAFSACGGDGYLQGKKKPTPEEVEAREGFLASRDDLDPLLRRQLRAFEITPEVALRRQAYVDAHPRLSPGARRLILRGEFVRGMAPDDVEASWGPPDLVEDVSAGERTALRWTYRRPAGPYHPMALVTRLVFEDGRLVDIREGTE